jgi:hypothetical protein
MTPEAQRIAIAEACGWTNIGWNGVYKDWLGSRPNEGRDTYPIPDYLHDLNAMHEAEKLLYGNLNLPKKYTQQIKNAIRREAGVTKAQMDFDVCITATAAQRAEAFIHTIGKWTTNPNEL